MITKCKSQLLLSKSKEKGKNPKQAKNGKKNKKEQNEKMQICTSKKILKMAHELRHAYEENFYQNENQNRSNIPPGIFMVSQKTKSYHQHHEADHEHQQPTMRRSASAGGIKPIRQVRKSLSPAASKQMKQKSDIKHKYSSKPTSRSQKQKIKQQPNFTDRTKSITLRKVQQGSEKNKMTRKKSQKVIKTHSQRLKTENSSKMPDNSKQIEKKNDKLILKNKSKKPVKPKNPIKINSTTKPKTKTSKIKQKLKNSIIFSEVSEHDTSPLFSAIATKQNFHVKLNQSTISPQQQRIINSCITIQRHFRGYLTRKYIQELKYEIFCIVKIQKVWRGYWCRKNLKKTMQVKKNLSIESSLMTIKDFSDEPKEQRFKNKSMKFGFEEFNRKQDLSSCKKSKTQDEQKYLQILETLLQEEGLDEKYKQKIRKTLGKEKYVQNKIISEIISQKSFNSPREMRSPKTNIIINSPSSWSRGKPAEAIENYCLSPRNNQIEQTLSKRISSPAQNKSASKSCKKLSSEVKSQIKLDIKPIETSFQFIEEFQLRIVDYLRDNFEVKQQFLLTCKKCEHLNTSLILSQWKNQKENLEFNYFFLTPTLFSPNIFSPTLRQQIINENSMKIYLEDNNYQKSIYSTNLTQQQICQSFIRCIFDGLSQAIFDNYKQEVLTKSTQNPICHYEGHQLFKMIFMNSLTLMQGWNEYMCGAQIPVDDKDPNYKHYCDKNVERLDIMIKSEVISLPFNCTKMWSLWGVLGLEEYIFTDLLEELYNQFFI